MFETIKPYLTVRNAIYFFSFIAGWPCVFYLMGWLPDYKINYIVLLILCILYQTYNSGHQIPATIFNIIVIQIVCWFSYSFLHSDTSYYTRILMLVITYMILRMQYNPRDRYDFIKVYDSWLLLQAICGTIGIMLVLGGILTPISTFREMDMRWGYNFGLFTTNTYESIKGFIRNAGFYDEPGALACWGMFALLFNKLFIKNTKIEILLIIGLISTLSMAYYIQLAFYLLVFYREKTWRLILIVAVIYISLKFIASYSDFMSNGIFGRFEFNKETGRFAGDNRSELFERCWNIFKQYPIFGAGARGMNDVADGFFCANFFYNWAADGLVGVIITYLPLLLLGSMGRLDKNYYGVSLIVLLGYFQRPFDTTQLLFPLILYSLLLNAYENTQRRFEE